MILGLTGGIASGKSTVALIFEGLGVEVVDADKIAKEVSERREVVEELVEIFGRGILVKKNIEKIDDKWEIDRKILREMVFSDSENVKKINKVIHPRVIEVFEERKKATLPNEIIIFDIPLLFEAKLEYLCEKILVITTSEKNQIKRIARRDGSNIETAKNIIKNQMSNREKVRKADYVIRNGNGIMELQRKVGTIYEKIIKKMDR